MLSCNNKCCLSFRQELLVVISSPAWKEYEISCRCNYKVFSHQKIEINDSQLRMWHKIAYGNICIFCRCLGEEWFEQTTIQNGKNWPTTDHRLPEKLAKKPLRRRVKITPLIGVK